MGQMCYICRRKASKRDQISLHKFPKNPIARNKWIKACDLSFSDDLTYIYVCSVHFNAKDIDRGNECQTRCILRTGAVPSIGVPNQICSKKENLDILNDGTENNAKMQLSTHASDEAPIQQCDDLIKRRRLVTADAILECEANENVRNSEESCDTTPKRRVFEPRYISEIRTPDFGTPKRTRKILYFVRDTNKKKSKLIKSLQDRNRKLEKRISSLEQIIAHLKKKNMVSNGTGDTLLESGHEIVKTDGEQLNTSVVSEVEVSEHCKSDFEESHICKSEIAHSEEVETEIVQTEQIDCMNVGSVPERVVSKPKGMKRSAVAGIPTAHKRSKMYTKVLDKSRDQKQPEIKVGVKSISLQVENEFDAYGRIVALQLKQMPLKEALLAQELIHGILRRHRVKALQREHYKNNRVSNSWNHGDHTYLQSASILPDDIDDGDDL